MADDAIRARDIEVPGKPLVFDQFLTRVNSPEDIDNVTKDLGIPASLLNPHLATVVDLSTLGLGQAVHIPVQIANRHGGRKSLYVLDVGEEVLAGVFVRDSGLILRYVRRTGGKPGRAQSGDTYSERLAGLDGTTLFESSGQLEIIDADAGHGQMTLSGTTLQAEAEPIKRIGGWIFWSCILID